MLVTNPFFCTCVEGEVAVEHTFYPVVSSDSGGSVDGIRPAVIQNSARVIYHKAETVHCRIAQHTHSQARTHVGRHCRNIGDTVVSACRIIGRLKSDCAFLAAHSLVETAPERIRAVTRNCVIHRNSGEINLL